MAERGDLGVTHPEGTPDKHEVDSLARRVQEMDVEGLEARLAALDDERQRRQGEPGKLDTSAADEALGSLRELLDAAEADTAQELEPLIAEREAALQALVQETELKLTSGRAPEVVGQGLRRLAEAVYQTRAFSGQDAPDEIAWPTEALTDFDDKLRATQQAARELLERELGLAMMPDQTGQRIDPIRHNVIGSEAGDDPLRDNTVARQEAPGWLLGEDVLAQADVVRYTSSAGGAPLLPDLEDVREHRVDDTMMGKKASRG